MTSNDQQDPFAFSNQVAEDAKKKDEVWDPFGDSKREKLTSAKKIYSKVPESEQNGLLSPNIGNSLVTKPVGLLSDVGTPNTSDLQNNPQISLISEKGLQKSMFEEDKVTIGEQKASLAEKLNQIKEKKRIKLKQSQSNKKEFRGIMDEEKDSENSSADEQNAD